MAWWPPPWGKGGGAPWGRKRAAPWVGDDEDLRVSNTIMLKHRVVAMFKFIVKQGARDDLCPD